MSTSAAQPDATATTAPPAPPAQLTMREVLRIDTMRRLWYAQIVSTLGDFLALFAVIGFLTFKLHANAQQVTGVQIAYLVPIAILGILAGVFVDRWPLKSTLVSSDVIRGILCLLLPFSTQIWQFYAILAAISVVSSFFGPAQGVVIREAVPLHGLRSSNSLMQTVMFGMRIVGPGIAGTLVKLFGYNLCYWLDAVSFFASATFIYTTVINRSPKVHKHTAAEDKGAISKILHDMQVGLNFILHHAGLLFVVLAMSAGMFILGCFGPLIAIYVRDSVHGNYTVYAAASAMIGLGMMVGINGLNTWGKNIKNNTLVYCGLLGIALGLVFLCVLTFVWSTILGDLIIGIAVAGIIIPAQTLMQQETPPELMGRVGSTFMSSVFTAQILGLLLSGELSRYLSIRTVFALCAAMLILLSIAGKLWMEPKAA